MRRGGLRVMSQRDRTGRGNRAASPLILRPRIAFRNVLLCYIVLVRTITVSAPHECRCWLTRIGGNG